MIDTEIILQSVEKHKETLATEVLIGKVYKEIVLTSVVKSIIKSTVSR